MIELILVAILAMALGFYSGILFFVIVSVISGGQILDKKEYLYYIRLRKWRDEFIFNRNNLIKR